MKKVIYLLMIACCFFACKDDNKNESESEPTMLVSPAEVAVRAEKETVNIEITTNVNYTYSVSEDWLRILSGTDHILQVEIDENENIEPRSAEIILTCEENLPDKIIPVTQAGISPRINIINGETQIIDYETKEVTILIESTDGCIISFNDGMEWLTWSEEKSGRNGLQYTYAFDVSDYHSGKQRKILVTFTQKNNPDLNVTVEILQNGGNPLPEITIKNRPENGFVFDVRQWIRIETEVTGTEDGMIEWTVNGKVISDEANLLHVMAVPGDYTFRLTAGNENGESYQEIPVTIREKEYDYKEVKVLEFLPAPGQFTNKMPVWVEGDTQEDMNKKASAAIRDGAISLGGFGGYVVMGFNHVLLNTEGAYDFRIKGNALSTWSEPGVITVSYDANGNGLPDDEWFEIAGSAYNSPSTIKEYEITYTLAETSPMLIAWTDNQGGSGEITKNPYHSQNYFPEWLAHTSYTLKGTKLTDEGVYDTSGNGTYWVSMPFAYGYVDNCMETQDCSKIKIDWAVDKDGNPVKLKGVDFVRVHCGINALAGWLGEVSTEIYGFEEFNINK